MSRVDTSHEEKRVWMVVEAKRPWQWPNLRALYRARIVARWIARRDLRALYRQSGLGPLWFLLKPLAQMTVYTIIFGGLARLDSNGIPYPLFIFCGLVPWTFFANCTLQSTHSLVSSGPLYTKVLFPRLALPLASMMVSSVDFLIQSVILLFMLFYFKVAPTSTVVLLPAFLVILILTAFGTSLLLGSFNIIYRDVSAALPLFIQAWFFLSPVVYSEQMVPERWRFIYSINPMSEVVRGVRCALVGTPYDIGVHFYSSLSIAVFLLVAGMVVFQRLESNLVDYMAN